jgi:hypothetical protein
MITHSANLADTRYSSLRDFLDAASLPARNPKNNGFMKYSDTGEGWSADWTGGANSTAKAVAAMSGQYASGAAIIKRIETASAKIKLPPKMDLRRRMVRGDHGDELDITAVYRGRLDIAWTRTQRRPVTASPMVSIVVNTICSSGDDASVISFRGAVGIVLAQLLERFGYRVRIVFAMGGTIVGADEKFSVRAILKDYGKPVNQEAIACATHPALFRVMGHRWMWAHANKRAEHGGARVGEALKEPNEVFISHEVNDERSAIAAIHKVIAGLTK